jgi:hypothetical protein
LIKTDTNGNKIWDKTLGGINHDGGYSVQQTNDKGYIITGYTDSFGAGDYDIWLIKIDGNGDKIWDRSFGGIDNEYGYSVQQTNDEGYIITGYTISFGAGNHDVLLIKTDSQGILSEPPAKPTIKGRINGKTNTEYEYKFMTTDPEGDNITYCINWGDDNTVEIWMGPYPSGLQILAKHVWEEQGSYIIKVKAWDVYGTESEWATFEVSMPKSKAIDTPLFLQKLFQHFTFFEKILNLN